MFFHRFSTQEEIISEEKKKEMNALEYDIKHKGKISNYYMHINVDLKKKNRSKRYNNKMTTNNKRRRINSLQTKIRIIY